jgi:cell division cycle 14
MEIRWFDWLRFDVDSYEYFEAVENGDMNWIVPEKFLAVSGPAAAPTDSDGFPTFQPEDYVPIFREAGITLVVRLNKKQYDRNRFINHGIKHVDLYFVDGSCPSGDIISKFLHITESEPGAVAVHCKAGLGRTGTLIGLYSMKHYRFPARAYIGWNRICRPGSILGPQQQFLCDMQNEMYQAGASLRGPGRALVGDSERAISAQMERLQVRDRTQAETAEDVGQGERLCNAKKQTVGGTDGRDHASLGSQRRAPEAPSLNRLRGVFNDR